MGKVSSEASPLLLFSGKETLDAVDRPRYAFCSYLHTLLARNLWF